MQLAEFLLQFKRACQNNDVLLWQIFDWFVQKMKWQFEELKLAQKQIHHPFAFNRLCVRVCQLHYTLLFISLGKYCKLLLKKTTLIFSKCFTDLCVVEAFSKNIVNSVKYCWTFVLGFDF